MSPTFRHDESVGHVLRLADGRNMGYAVFGDPDGLPILNCHGGLLCRFDVEPCDKMFRELGVSVVSPDRPGVGLSDRWPGHSTADWTDDVRELLDALGVEHVAVMGWSLGGQYAAAVAARLGGRVSRAAIIAGALPLDDPLRLSQLNRLDQRLVRMSQRAEPFARAAFSATSMLGRRAASMLGRYEANRLPPADAKVVRANDEWFGRAMGEGTQNSAGMVDEYRAFSGPWGFALGDIAVPTHVYQGVADTMIPASWGAVIADAIPDSQLTMYDDEGHMIALSHRDDVVRDLLVPVL